MCGQGGRPTKLVTAAAPVLMAWENVCEQAEAGGTMNEGSWWPGLSHSGRTGLRCALRAGATGQQ